MIIDHGRIDSENGGIELGCRDREFFEQMLVHAKKLEDAVEIGKLCLAGRARFECLYGTGCMISS